MHNLRYVVVVAGGPVPIHFPSITQAIRVADRVSPDKWTIRVVKACSDSVCAEPHAECASVQHAAIAGAVAARRG